MSRSRYPILPWSGVVQDEQVNPLANLDQYSFGGFMKKNLGTIGGLVGGTAGFLVAGPAGASLGYKAGSGLGNVASSGIKSDEEKDAEIAEIQQERVQNQSVLNERSAGSNGVVPGVANPYMLALGGLSTSSKNQEEFLTEYDSGGLHGENPMGGIPIGTTKKGTQNSVEQGEASFDFDDGKYIFSNRLIV